MRAQSPRPTAVSVLFTVSILLILLAAIGSPLGKAARHRRNAAPAVQCPAQTVKQGSQCVLKKDTDLKNTLRLSSGTKLNCQGHTLRPTATPENGSGLSQRSAPEVAIFLNNVQNIQIQNCVIEGFDFGIFAIKSKVPAAIKNNPGVLAQRRNKILQNTINARFLAISLASVDNTEIKDNTIKYTTAGGKGIYVGRDSDLNRVNNNTITGDIASLSSQAVGAPGPMNSSSNPVVPVGQAVLVTQTLAPDPTLLNAIIEGELHQLSVANSPVVNGDFSEDNLVEGNIVVFTQTPFDGIATAVTLRTTVRGNTVRNTLNSIRAGIQSGANGIPKKFPGKCSAPVAGRLCLADIDCNILGATGSACDSPAPPTVPVFWVSDGFLVEGNTITGPFNGGIATTAKNTIIRGNTITGPLRSTGTGAINLVAKFGLGPTTAVTRNVVSNVAIVLALNNKPAQVPDLPASTFEARVSLNDFTKYTTSVRSDIAATLSANGQGNFWELPCPLGFDPAKVQKVNLPSSAVVTDDHPYGTSVAKTAAGSLPQPCQ
jgi:Periplasmic copper-binding protein (NosD)